MGERPTWVGDVLGFWFEETRPEAWFKKDDAFDGLIRRRFAALVAELSRETPATAFDDVQAALAAVIVLDQFPRNIHRGSPQAFAADPAALMLASHAVARGFDQQVMPARRVFFYLPFEHSESVAVQARSMALMASLGDASFADYARRHKLIVDRFGRFPHRNVALGRVSTAEEIEFLKQPGSSF